MKSMKAASAKVMRGVKTPFGNAVSSGSKTAKVGGGRKSSRGGKRY